MKLHIFNVYLFLTQSPISNVSITTTLFSKAIAIRQTLYRSTNKPNKKHWRSNFVRANQLPKNEVEKLIFAQKARKRVADIEFQPLSAV